MIIQIVVEKYLYKVYNQIYGMHLKYTYEYIYKIILINKGRLIRDKYILSLFVPLLGADEQEKEYTDLCQI